MLKTRMRIRALGLMALAASAGAVQTEARAESSYAAEVAAAAQAFTDRAVHSAQELVLQAMGLIGIRYRFGGRSPATGFDCSGFVRYVFARVTGRQLPATSFEQAAAGTVIGKSELQPGDLVFYNTRGRPFSHVGIYIGEGRFIHSPSRGGSVHIVNMSERYWLTRFNGARRLAL
jgi:cell wall-associated NlpC family hydrolase